MPKYYVESGPELQVVVTARDVFEAVIKALECTAQQAPLRLADLIIVNERGFLGPREHPRIRGDEAVFPTRLLLGEPQVEGDARHG